MTTWNSPSLDLTQIKPRQAAGSVGLEGAGERVAVAGLKAAGAIVLGKTKVPINLGDWQSYNEILYANL
jgi:Asp-tRNA(Asn)/Glu-tRNA(Gln) amidotransferase A subunit family amidase